MGKTIGDFYAFGIGFHKVIRRTILLCIRSILSNGMFNSYCHANAVLFAAPYPRRTGFHYLIFKACLLRRLVAVPLQQHWRLRSLLFTLTSAMAVA